MNARDRNGFAGGDGVQRGIVASLDNALVFVCRAHQQPRQFQVNPALQRGLEFVPPVQLDRLELQTPHRRGQRRPATERSAHRLRQLQAGGAGRVPGAFDFRVEFARLESGGGEGAALALPGFVARLLSGNVFLQPFALRPA